MSYYSDDKQDMFVANLLKFKRDGTYVDIGSCSAIGSNNSYFFESLDWKGICIEKNSHFNDSYNERTCRYINDDATKIWYELLFNDFGFPESIDYLSLDVDEASTEVLKRLPLDKYRFKVVTIEHDSHFFGNVYKDEQRKILTSKNYFLLFGDVLNQSGRNIGQEHNWEDWWCDPYCFDRAELERLQAYRLNTEQIINKLK